MPIYTTRRMLARALYTYGEFDLAAKFADVTPDQMDAIANRADVHADEGLMFATALALAAVEVLEGEPRPLARSRRRMSDGSRADLLVFAPWPDGFWGPIDE
jgi:hypothetical protein